MLKIAIKEKSEIKEGWKFIVELEEAGETMEYETLLFSADWLRLTGGTSDPSELVHKAFEFLVEREPKEAILRSFNITDIGKYFPDFEHEIKQ